MQFKFMALFTQCYTFFSSLYSDMLHNARLSFVCHTISIYCTRVYHNAVEARYSLFRTKKQLLQYKNFRLFQMFQTNLFLCLERPISVDFLAMRICVGRSVCTFSCNGHISKFSIYFYEIFTIHDNLSTGPDRPRDYLVLITTCHLKKKAQNLAHAHALFILQDV